jgi:uncharacterized protein (TIGR04222 family)
MNAAQDELHERIEKFPLDEPDARFPFTARLSGENNWSEEYANRVVKEYKRFVFLAVAAGHSVTPSDQVDQAWHLHLTYTQSYWARFCQEVLKKPLHHNPTQGGPAEQTKFVEWYNRTLESYRRFFGNEPPADIWPDAETRFGEDLHHRRVNTKRNWIVPKGPLKWLAASAALLFAGLSAVAGCVSQNGGHSAIASAPIATDLLDLRGSEFLSFFAVAFAVAVCIATIFRWYMRRSAQEPSPEPFDLDPYEVTYLAGGEQMAVNAALATLVSRGALKVQGDEHRLLRQNGGQTLEGHDPSIRKSRANRKDLRRLDSLNRPEYFGHRIQQLEQEQTGGGLPALLHPLEEAILDTVDPALGASIDELRRDWPPLVEIADRLKSLSLIVSDERDWIGRVLPVLVALAVPLLGAIKILVGLSRDKPVGILVIGCIITVIAAFAAFGRRLLRTWEGDRVLERMKEENTALMADVEGSRGELVGPDLALALGLFGIDVLEAGPLAELHAALKPQTGSAGGCGGDGGGCDGGCGGCGGCG